MADKQKLLLGAIMLVVLAGSGILYLTFNEEVRIRVDKDQTSFYVPHEQYDWIWTVSGREKSYIFDGNTKLYRDVDNITVDHRYNEETDEIWITRTTPYKRGPVKKDIYYFKGSVKQKKLFPISHKVRVLNASGKFFRYVADDLHDTGEMRDFVNQTYFEFGKDMSLEIEPGYRWAWIGLYYGDDSFSAQYDIDSDNETYSMRLFDPSSNISINRVFPNLVNNNYNVIKNEFFNITFNVTCLNGSCGNVNVSLESTEKKYEQNRKEAIAGYQFDGTSKLRGQTFTVGSEGRNESFTLTRVVIVPDYYGDFGSNKQLTAKLYETNSSGIPKGSVLSNGSANYTSVANVSMKPYKLSKGETYALVFNETGGGTTYDNSGDEYGGGNLIRSDDGGDSWSVETNEDSIFEVWGVLSSPNHPGLIPIEDEWNKTDPFYTNKSSNPYTTDNLSEGESELMTFNINAKGNLSYYRVFGYANETNDLSISDTTEKWDVTIQEPFSLNSPASGSSVGNQSYVLLNVSTNASKGNISFYDNSSGTPVLLNEQPVSNYNTYNWTGLENAGTKEWFVNVTVATENSETWNFSYYSQLTSQCRDMNYANRTYELVSDINATKNDCLDSNSENITLNGKGYTVDGLNSYDHCVRGDPQNISINNIIVRNCDRGIWLGKNATVKNSKVYNDTYQGISTEEYSLVFNSSVLNSDYGFSIYQNSIINYSRAINISLDGFIVKNAPWEIHNSLSKNNDFGVNVDNNYKNGSKIVNFTSFNDGYGIVIYNTLGASGEIKISDSLFNTSERGIYSGIASLQILDSVFNCSDYAVYSKKYDDFNSNYSYINDSQIINGDIKGRVDTASAGKHNISVINTTYGDVTEDIGSNVTLLRKWYFDGDYKNETGDEITANLSVIDVFDDLVFSILTHIESWDLDRVFKKASDNLYAVSISPNNKYLAAGSEDENVYVFNSRDGSLEANLSLATGWIRSTDFSNDGNYLAVGSSDNHTYVYDVDNWTLVEKLNKSESYIRDVKFSKDSKYLASGGGDENVYIYNTTNWNLVQNLTAAGATLSSPDINSIDFSDDYIAYGTSNKNVYLHNLSNWNNTQNITGLQDDVNAVAFSNDGNYLAHGGYYYQDGIHIHNTSNWSLIKKLNESEGEYIYSIDFSDDYIAYGGADKKIHMHKIGSWSYEYNLTEATDDVNSLEFSDDNNYIVYGGDDNDVFMNSKFKEGVMPKRTLTEYERNSSDKTIFTPHKATVSYEGDSYDYIWNQSEDNNLFMDFTIPSVDLGYNISEIKFDPIYGAQKELWPDNQTETNPLFRVGGNFSILKIKLNQTITDWDFDCAFNRFFNPMFDINASSQKKLNNIGAAGNMWCRANLDWPNESFKGRFVFNYTE